MSPISSATTCGRKPQDQTGTQLPKANRPFDLLVSPGWSSFSHGPKRLSSISGSFGQVRGWTEREAEQIQTQGLLDWTIWQTLCPASNNHGVVGTKLNPKSPVLQEIPEINKAPLSQNDSPCYSSAFPLWLPLQSRRSSRQNPPDLPEAQ